MRIDKELLDRLTAQAKVSPRLRMNYDLRTMATCPEAGLPEDSSQRMLNAMEPGTVLPIHRHRRSTETVVVLRGRLRQNFYSLAPDPSPEGEGRLVPTLVESLVCEAGGEVSGFSVEVGRWHNTECLESGTVILECKDGRSFDKLRNNESLSDEDILKV